MISKELVYAFIVFKRFHMSLKEFNVFLCMNHCPVHAWTSVQYFKSMRSLRKFTNKELFPNKKYKQHCPYGPHRNQNLVILVLSNKQHSSKHQKSSKLSMTWMEIH